MLQVEPQLVEVNLGASILTKEACEDHLVTMQVAEKIRSVGVKHFKLQVAQQSGWRKLMGQGHPI